MSWTLDWFYFGDISTLAYSRHGLAATLYERLLKKDAADLKSLFGATQPRPHPLIDEIEAVAMSPSSRSKRFEWDRSAFDNLMVQVVSGLGGLKAKDHEMLLTPDTLYINWDEIAARSADLKEKVEDAGIQVPALGQLPTGMYLWVEATFATADPLAAGNAFPTSEPPYETIRKKADRDQKGSIGSPFPVTVTAKRRDKTSVVFGEKELTFDVGTGSNTFLPTEHFSEKENDSATPPFFCAWPSGAINGC